MPGYLIELLEVETESAETPALQRCQCGRIFSRPTRCGDCDTNTYPVSAPKVEEDSDNPEGNCAWE